jgi:hypothetical protein
MLTIIAGLAADAQRARDPASGAAYRECVKRRAGGSRRGAR